MELRNIYRGAECLGQCTLEQARALLRQGELWEDDVAGEDGLLVGQWVEAEHVNGQSDEVGGLPRPEKLPPPPDWCAPTDLPEPGTGTRTRGRVKREPRSRRRDVLMTGLREVRKPREHSRSLRRDFLMAGLGAVGGVMGMRLWSGRSVLPIPGFNTISEAALMRSVVMVRIDAAPSGTGTGFCVAPGSRPDGCVILTASHVVDHGRLNSLTGDARLASVVTAGGRQVALRTPWIWESNLDACAISVDLGLEPLPLAEELPKIGAPVTAVGFLIGRGIVTAKGVVTGFHYDKVARIETSAATIPGYSGGPVLNERGEVVGMSVTRSLQGAVRSESVPLQELRNMADRVAFLRRVEESP